MVNNHGMGRKKIEIRKIEKKKSLQVTFSKRRKGLFKKVGDLCSLCDVEAAVIVFSPAGRPFVFGHPSADSVIDRFLRDEAHSSASMEHGQRQRLGLGAPERMQVERAGEEASVIGNRVGGFPWVGGGQGEERGQRQCLGVPERPKVEREREEAVAIGDGEAGFWWDAPIENMGLSELERFKASIEEFRQKVADRVEEMTMMMETVVSNATVEYPTPPGPQPQLPFQCQPHELDSSPLLDGVPCGLDCGFGFDEGFSSLPDGVPCGLDCGFGFDEGFSSLPDGVPCGLDCGFGFDEGFSSLPEGVRCGFDCGFGFDEGSSRLLDGVPYGFDCGFGFDEARF